MLNSVGNQPPFPGLNGPEGMPMYVAVPQVQGPPPPSESGSGITVGMLIAAFRRRWFLAVCVGLTLGAAAAAVVWRVLPVTYTASAEFLVQPNKPVVYDHRVTGEIPVDVLVYKESLRRQAKFPEVITATLRNPEVAASTTIREQEDPETWLRENIDISSPSYEFLQISLTTPHRVDVAVIVNAYAAAFKTKIIDEERIELEAVLEKQRIIKNKADAALQSKRKQLKDIDSDIAANTEQANLKLEKINTRSIQFEQLLGQLEILILDAQFKLRLHQEEQQRLAQAPPMPEPAPAEQVAPEPAAEPELPPIEIPEIPDQLVEARLLNDVEFQRLFAARDNADKEVTIWTSKVQDNHPRLREKRDTLAAATKALDDFKATRMPLVRQEIVDELRQSMENERALAIEAARNRQQIVQQVASVQAAENAPTPQQVESRLQTEIANMASKRDIYRKQLEQLEVEARELTTQWVDREVLAEQVENLKAETQFLGDRIKAREIEYQNTPPRVRERRPAQEPRHPDSDNRIKLSAMTGLGLFALSIVLVVWQEHIRRKVNSTGELNQTVGLQLMATIPVIPRSVSGKGKKGDSRAAFWHSVLTESFDSARTMLLRNADLNSIRAVMIGSAVGSEGKTTLSCHLATSLARSGRRVLLIDGDIRRPSVHRVFNIENVNGLCNVLLGQSPLEECTVEVNPGLHVLPAGRYQQGAITTLSQDPIRLLLEDARAKFDFVIVDSSPVLPVTDGLLIAQQCDGVLMAVRKDVSQLHKVSSAVDKFRMLGVRIIGAVAIGLDSGNTYGQRYSYNYGYNSATSAYHS